SSTSSPTRASSASPKSSTIQRPRRRSAQRPRQRSRKSTHNFTEAMPMKIHGREYTRRDVLSRVGRMEQIGGARRVRMTEGPEDGTEVIEVRTGAGMEFDVHPGRGMDVGRCELFGGALAWL